MKQGQPSLIEKRFMLSQMGRRRLLGRNLDAERVSNRMNTLCEDERQHAKERGRVQLTYTHSQQSMRELDTVKRQKENHVTAGIHGAVNMICKEIEKILAQA